MIKTYFTGQPCKRGHVAERYVSDCACIACTAEKNKARRAANPEGERARKRAWTEANPEKVRAHSRKWREVNPEKAKATVRVWEEANREKRRVWNRARRQADPEKHREFVRAWARANPERERARVAKRRALQRGARVGCRKAYAAFLRWTRTAPNVRCYWCGARTGPKQRHTDHIVPLSRGGADAVENLCVSCVGCNLRKNDKMPEVFAGQTELRFA
jgi:5-methylcytosine-specific restriction endonuclease McrA